MSKKLIIFGAGDIAELAKFYFTEDSEYEVIAFCVDEEFITSDQFCGLPLVSSNHVVDKYDPSTHSMFVALSYSKLNLIRKEKYELIKGFGYEVASYISSRATILNDKIGENCFILEDNTVQPFVEIGNNVTLWSGNHIGHHSIISDHTFIASHVVVSGGVNIGKQCFIGVNATLRDHIYVGDNCVIGAGALLLNDAEEGELYIGSKTEKSDRATKSLKKI